MANQKQLNLYVYYVTMKNMFTYKEAANETI